MIHMFDSPPPNLPVEPVASSGATPPPSPSPTASAPMNPPQPVPPPIMTPPPLSGTMPKPPIGSGDTLPPRLPPTPPKPMGTGMGKKEPEDIFSDLNTGGETPAASKPVLADVPAVRSGFPVRTALIVLGGLIEDSVTDTDEQVPGLGSLPVCRDTTAPADHDADTGR